MSSEQEEQSSVVAGKRAGTKLTDAGTAGKCHASAAQFPPTTPLRDFALDPSEAFHRRPFVNERQLKTTIKTSASLTSIRCWSTD